MLELYGFIFILILGTLSHFIYEWSSHNKYASIFFAVNESVWEHLKMVVFPSLIWLIIEIPIIGRENNFLTAKFVSLFSMLIFIPLFFYSYQAILKKDYLFMDIIDFVLAVATGQYLGYLVMNIKPIPFIYNYLSLILLILISISFLIATYYPGTSILYKDPISHKKGLAAHEYLDKYFYKKNK